MEEKTRTLGYICPQCRQAVVVRRSVFQLAAGANQLSCPCGKSTLHLEVEEERVRLGVPCLFCKKDHRVTCATEAFFQKKALAFSCGASGLGCLYVGEEEAVFSAMRRLEETVDKVEVEQEERGLFLDEVIMHEMLSEIKEIAARGGVTCTCGCKEWGMQVHYSTIDLCCAGCGGVLRLSAATDQDLEDLCCKVRLTIPGR